MNSIKVIILGDADSAHIMNWAKGLRQYTNVELVIFSLRMPSNRSWYEGLNVKVYYPKNASMHAGTSAIEKAAYLKVVPHLRKIIRAEKPDIVHAHYATSYGLLALLSRGKVPYAVSVWGSDVFDFPTQSRLNARILKRIFKRAAAVFSTSEIMKYEARKYCKSDIEVIPFGVEIDKFSVEKSNNGPITFGILKSLQQVYNIETAIMAFEKLVETTDREVRLLIAGDGPLEDSLKSLTHKNNLSHHVRFLGRLTRKEVPSFLKDVHVLLNPSIHESFGVSIIEASASGAVVIGSDVGGIREVIVPNETGYLLPPSDINAWTEKMLYLVNNPEIIRKLGLEGARMVIDSFSLESCSLRQEEAYKKMLS